jgi:hypothetical protein
MKMRVRCMKPGPYLRGVYGFKPPEILEKIFSIRKFAVNTIGKAHKIQELELETWRFRL